MSAGRRLPWQSFGQCRKIDTLGQAKDVFYSTTKVVATSMCWKIIYCCVILRSVVMCVRNCTHLRNVYLLQYVVGRDCNFCWLCFFCFSFSVCLCVVWNLSGCVGVCKLLWWCVCLCVCVFGFCSVFCVSGFLVSTFKSNPRSCNGVLWGFRGAANGRPRLPQGGKPFGQPHCKYHKIFINI